MAYEHLVGWSYWQFKHYEDFTRAKAQDFGSVGFYDYEGNLLKWKLKALSRSYLRFTQGQLKSMEFNTETATLKASIVVDSSIDAATVIF